ncbi:MAG: BNR/Asp-box repeat protein [Pedosphaera sp.]|nr:BNR/Asp-box repeat protein [Pedosphaera sp.]
MLNAGCATQSDNQAESNSILHLQRGAWVNVSDQLLPVFAQQNIKPIIKFAYDVTNGAGICGILADRSLGGPWIIVQGQGVWKYQPTTGVTHQRIDAGNYDAFYENAGPDIDPEGLGVCLFSIQGQTTNSTCAIARNGGKKWTALTTDSAAFGYDVGAVNWTDGGMTILAKKHHNGDLVLSHDGGKTWTLLGKGQSRVMALGLIGSQVLLKGVRGDGDAGGLFRSTDEGTNWSKVADCQFNRLGHVVVFHGAAYLTCTNGILVSHDQGRHWSLPGKQCPGLRVPVMFGKYEQHLMVYGDQGFYESHDGGMTWILAVAFGEDPALRSGRFEYGAWNPNDDTFFITHIRGQAFGYQR